MIVPKEEIEAVREAILVHAEKYERNHTEALAVFDETIRQLKEYLEELASSNTQPLH